MIIVVTAFAGCRESPSPQERTEHEAVQPAPMASQGLPTPPQVIGWLGIGGGSLPSLNQVSLEDDVRLARRVFGSSGSVFFAGGAGSDGVQVLDPTRRGAPLLNALADLFAPRAGRDAHYRKTTLDSVGMATGPKVFAALDAALASPASEPLTVFVTAHGDKGKVASDNAVLLWGGYDLRPTDMAAKLARAKSQRQVRLVMTSCFSGGFAEVIFEQANSARGPAAGPVRVCGLFAAPWDRESTGCDPNPDRRAHHGYGLHFLHALQRRDRLGRPLQNADIDFDGDGRVSLLEAHTRVRLASQTMDLPTTTSERWLRHVAPKSGPEEDVALAEEDALITRLSQRLGTRDPAPELERRRSSVDSLQAALEVASRAERDAYHDVASELLRRWPVLDDAWHPDFAPTLARQGTHIRAWLHRSSAYARYLKARQDYDSAGVSLDTARVAMAPWERLERALETQRLARRLKARRDLAWQRYRGLLKCERGSPPRSR